MTLSQFYDSSNSSVNQISGTSHGVLPVNGSFGGGETIIRLRAFGETHLSF